MSVMPWSGWTAAICIDRGRCICEANQLAEWARHPQAASSSLFLLLVGLGLMLTRQSKTWAWALVFAAVGSLFFHVSATHWGEVADFATICGLASWWLAPAQSHRHGKYWFIGTLGSGVLIYFVPEWRFAPTAVTVLAAMVILSRQRSLIALKSTQIGLMVLVLASGFFLEDVLQWYCQPILGLYGHTWWHLLSACGLGLLQPAAEIHQGLVKA